MKEILFVDCKGSDEDEDDDQGNGFGGLSIKSERGRVL